MDVGNTAELNNAISCYNSKTTDGFYSINFSADITLTAPSTVISNTKISSQLIIFGNTKQLSGANTYRGLEIAPDTKVRISSLTIRAGKTDTNGGGILNSGILEVFYSTLISNSAQIDGGGISNSGTLTVYNSTLRDNAATNGSGGGIANASNGTLEVQASTLISNSAQIDGGGIRNNGPLTVYNSTFSGNAATNGSGGGIANASNGTLLVINSTLNGNAATNGSGGGIDNNGGLTLRNTIIANSPSGGDCVNKGSGSLTSQTNNLIKDSAAACGIANGANGSIIGQDPLLAPLADDGFGLLTHALLANSPAIDKGNAATCAAEPVRNNDQIGTRRPVGDACDIGAREFIPPSVCNFPATVSTPYSLTNALTCYNSLTTAGVYTIIFSADITLDRPNTRIENANAGVALHINGNNKVLSGANSYQGLEIALDTKVTVDGLTIRNGQAGSGGGISNRGTLTVANSTLISNTAAYGNGGGISNSGTLTVSNSTLSGNAATYSDSDYGNGGAIDNGSNSTLTVINSTFNNNSARFFGGAIYNNDTGTLTVSNSTLNDNSATDSSGGGIFNRGTQTVSNSTFSGNKAKFGGGGISSNGPQTVSNSTFSGNAATNGSGGGIENSGPLTVTNSTLSGNSANFGGGISSYGPLGVINSTLSGNAATNGSGGGIDNNGSLTIRNTIIANSPSGGDCVNRNSGSLTSQTNNLIKDSAAACGIADGTNGSIIGQDPLLAPLADDGGSTRTHALLANSPAIDKGNAATCTAAPVNNRDQIGAIRPQGAACDIGAREFIPPTKHNLTVLIGGQGKVTSVPAGIDCGATCLATYTQGVTVTLTATPTNGYVFVRWIGACTGTGACQVTMDTAKTVTAEFAEVNATTQRLTVNKVGSGTVKSTPTGINCGAICNFDFKQGAPVTLEPIADAGFTFIRWDGACSGTGDCTVTLDAAKTVTATFKTTNVATPTLTVTKAGSGSGTFKSTPAGINCSATCSASFTLGASVTLTATADPDSTFDGWLGAGCSGTGTCQVTMDGAKSVTATFTRRANVTLTVTKAGSGSGTFKSTPAGINCSATCTAPFTFGAAITLTATADAGSTFAGWSGACSGTGACQVKLDSAKTVTATFNKANGTAGQQKIYLPTVSR